MISDWFLTSALILILYFFWIVVFLLEFKIFFELITCWFIQGNIIHPVLIQDKLYNLALFCNSLAIVFVRSFSACFNKSIFLSCKLVIFWFKITISLAIFLLKFNSSLAELVSSIFLLAREIIKSCSSFFRFKIFLSCKTLFKSSWVRISLFLKNSLIFNSLSKACFFVSNSFLACAFACFSSFWASFIFLSLSKNNFCTSDNFS